MDRRQKCSKLISEISPNLTPLFPLKMRFFPLFFKLVHRNCLIFGTKVNLDNTYTLAILKSFGKILMNGFREKCENLPFLGIFGQKGLFWTVFGQNGRNGIFSKKRLENFVRIYNPWLQSLRKNEWKNSEKKRCGRTNERTDGRGLNSRFLRINIRRTNKLLKYRK